MSEKKSRCKLKKENAAEIKDLILSINNEPDDNSFAGISTSDVWFQHRDLGGIFLSGELSKKYRLCLSNLMTAFNKYDQISPRMINKLLQKAVLKSLDIFKRNADISIDERVDQSIKEIEIEILRKPHEFKTYLQVNGISGIGLPLSIGGIEFIQFGDRELTEFKLRVSKANYPPESMETDLSSLSGKVVAVIDTLALDETAARTVAINRLRVIIDVINFFSDLIPYADGFAYLPGEVERLNITIPSLVNTDGFNIKYEALSPLIDLSLEKLFQEDKERNFGLLVIDRMLKTMKNPLDERIVASVQWAGRATVFSKKRKEEAFLLYIIALESIILADQDHVELSYRLKLRVSHFLGNDYQSRSNIFQEINRLYRIRSGIVHSGQFEVTDKDISTVRYLTKHCLIKLLTEEPFSSMQSIQDLPKWFDKQILE